LEWQLPCHFTSQIHGTSSIRCQEYQGFFNQDAQIHTCKAIEGDKANSVKDLDSISKTAWGFISFLYEVYWDSLIVDNSKTLFRNKVKSKFSPQIVKVPVNVKGKKPIKPTYIFSLPPSIPAKSPKEVNKISKYFKKNPPSA